MPFIQIGDVCYCGALRVTTLLCCDDLQLSLCYHCIPHKSIRNCYGVSVSCFRAQFVCCWCAGALAIFSWSGQLATLLYECTSIVALYHGCMLTCTAFVLMSLLVVLIPMRYLSNHPRPRPLSQDENNNVVGAQPRSVTVRKRLLGRGAYTLVFNSKGQLLVSKRSQLKVRHVHDRCVRCFTQFVCTLFVGRQSAASSAHQRMSQQFGSCP